MHLPQYLQTHWGKKKSDFQAGFPVGMLRVSIVKGWKEGSPSTYCAWAHMSSEASDYVAGQLTKHSWQVNCVAFGNRSISEMQMSVKRLGNLSTMCIRKKRCKSWLQDAGFWSVLFCTVVIFPTSLISWFTWQMSCVNCTTTWNSESLGHKWNAVWSNSAYFLMSDLADQFNPSLDASRFRGDPSQKYAG